jgi:hypothetical protein
MIDKKDMEKWEGLCKKELDFVYRAGGHKPIIDWIKRVMAENRGLELALDGERLRCKTIIVHAIEAYPDRDGALRKVLGLIDPAT